MKELFVHMRCYLVVYPIINTQFAVRLLVCNAHCTPYGFWNAVEWRLLHKNEFVWPKGKTGSDTGRSSPQEVEEGLQISCIFTDIYLLSKFCAHIFSILHKIDILPVNFTTNKKPPSCPWKHRQGLCQNNPNSPCFQFLTKKDIFRKPTGFVSRPSKCPKFYTNRILGEKNVRQKSA